MCRKKNLFHFVLFCFVVSFAQLLLFCAHPLTLGRDSIATIENVCVCVSVCDGVCVYVCVCVGVYVCVREKERQTDKQNYRNTGTEKKE